MYFVSVCPKEENMKKKMINEKIKIKIKLANNALLVITLL